MVDATTIGWLVVMSFVAGFGGGLIAAFLFAWYSVVLSRRSDD